MVLPFVPAHWPYPDVLGTYGPKASNLCPVSQVTLSLCYLDFSQGLAWSLLSRYSSRFLWDITCTDPQESSTVSQISLMGLCCRKRRHFFVWQNSRLRLKCDGTRAETRFRLSAKRTSPLKSAGVSVQSTTGSRGVRISGSSAGYTVFWGSVKSTDYPLYSPVSPSLSLPWVTVCHYISTGLYSRTENNVAQKRCSKIMPNTNNEKYICPVP